MGELKLEVGANKITVEVTSEDGTVNKYFLDCSRLCASSASLKSLGFTDIRLEPGFESEVCNKTVGLTELFLNKRNES